MTISDVDVRAVYSGNGSTTTFAIPFDYVSTSEIKVYLRDTSETPAVETLQTLTTHYTISAPNIVFVTAPASTDQVLVIRVNSYTQATDFLNTGTFNPENIELALDKLTRLVQEVEEKTDRALKFALTSSNANFDVPEPVASYAIGFNSAGTGLTTFNTDSITDPIVNADVDPAAAIAFSKMADLTASRALASDSSGDVSVTAVTSTELGYLSGVTSAVQTQLLAANAKNLGTHNIAVIAATTTNANDSIKITSADGTALSASNIGYVVMQSATSGLVSVLSMTADVTINITGAHWGNGTLGDLTDQKLVVYAINDAGTLKWGVGLFSQVKSIGTAQDETTATSVTTNVKVLVNSALSGNCNVMMVARVTANFDDTGGAAEDLWAVQTGFNDTRMGFENIPIHVHYNTNTLQSFTTSTQTIVNYEDRVIDTHFGVTVGAGWVFTAPVSGFYCVSAGVALQGNAGWGQGEIVQLLLFNQASVNRQLFYHMIETTATLTHNCYGSAVVQLTASNALDLRFFQNSGGSITLDSTVTSNYVDITLIGEYNQ